MMININYKFKQDTPPLNQYVVYQVIYVFLVQNWINAYKKEVIDPALNGFTFQID